MLDDVLLLIKKLDTKGDSIKIAGANLKLLTQLQGRLQTLLLNPNYIQNVKDYVSDFNKVTELQHDYFREVEAKFKPPKLAKEIQKQAIGSVVNQLTENGLNANVVDKVQNILRQAVTTGGSYATLSQQLTDFLVNNKSGDGQLLRYTKQITTDAINDFSGQYTQLISSDLGLEWFRYSGTNIETTRPFCLACTERKWFHISELPKVLKGEFDEFIKYDGVINKKTGLPNGMKPGTDISNFQTLRGGYNCEHQWRPCSEDIVPDEVKQRVYAKSDYLLWAKQNNKKLPVIPKDKEKPKETPVNSVESEEPTTTSVDLNSAKEIKNIYDVNDLLKKEKDKLKEFFNNTEFKSLRITKKKNTNGSTDMNGNISLSVEKSRLFSEALNNIKNKVDLTIEHEMSIATFWHEVWHNTNKESNIPFLTDRQTEYMELGNEFAARKTLDDAFTLFGTKLKNTSLKNNRKDTGYNVWVKNYDKLIEYFGCDSQSTISFMTEKMKNGEYGKVKEYLIEAIVSNTKKVNEKEVKSGVQDAINLSEKDFDKKYTTH